MVELGLLRLIAISCSYSVASLILAGLRATGIVSWGWEWILCPLWLPLALAAIGFGGVLLVKLVAPRTESDPL